MHKKIIANTSPLFYLHKLGCFDILQKLYGEIITPSAVVKELEEGNKIGIDVPFTDNFNWIRVEKVSIPKFIKLIPDLGAGEAEVLALGCEKKDSLLILDDALARKIAKLQKLKVTGTIGILLKAKERKYIVEIAPILKKLKEANFYLHDELIKEILKISGETNLL